MTTKSNRELFRQLGGLTTEAQDKSYKRLDRESLRKVLTCINDADATVPRAIQMH